MIEPAPKRSIQSLRIVVPLFNDWASLAILLRELDQIAPALTVKIAITVIDDGSTRGVGSDLSGVRLKNIDSAEVIHLSTNLGHQRAIAIGLCAAIEGDSCDAILVMDADGQDPPQSIVQMLQAAGDSADFCVVARRGKRSENWAFKFSYVTYKVLFKLLTGGQIDFGNFCLLSRDYARRLVHIPDLWNNLPAAILRSRLPIQQISIDRGHRYTGESKMNLTSLVVHGLSGISVFAETIFVRLLFLTLSLFFLSGISIGVVSTLRIFFPRYATPGWATTVSFGVAIILVQALSFTLLLILMLLNGRVQRLVLPVAEYKYYVRDRQPLLAS